MTNTPNFRAVVNVGDKRWEEIGAAWNKDKGNISLSFKAMPIPKNGKMNVLLVPIAE
jgi:hypothetical protein